MTQLPDFVAKMSANERLDLIELLWDSLDQTDDIVLTDAQRHELESRVEAINRGELGTQSLEMALSTIRRGRSG